MPSQNFVEAIVENLLGKSLAYFSTDEDEIWYGVGAVQTKQPDITSEWVLVIKEIHCGFTDCVKKTHKNLIAFINS